MPSSWLKVIPANEAQVGYLEREGSVAVGFEIGGRAREGVVAPSAQGIERRRPFATRESIDPLAVRLPVSGVLGVEALHEDDAFDRLLGIVTLAARAAFAAQQPLLLVVAQRAHAHTGPLGELSDPHPSSSACDPTHNTCL